MKQAKYKSQQSGLLLVEILLAVALTSLITLIIMSSIIYGRESTAVAGDRSRAAEIANMTVEAVNNIAQDNYANLSTYSDGTSYFLDTSVNTWQLSSSPTTIDSRFTSVVMFAGGPNGSRMILVSVSWQINNQRSGSVVATGFLSDWRADTVMLNDGMERFG